MNTRRQFLKSVAGTSALLAYGSAAPRVWCRASMARDLPPQSDRVLVVIQLSGGNDGVNTLVPYGDDEYRRRRFTLALDQNAIHKIDDYVGLHPSMDGMHELADEGKLAIVQGVGYPNPNRSHFESMDLWHTAHRPTEPIATGWLGRCLDVEDVAEQTDVAALHLGGEDQPLALAAESTQVPTIRSMDEFRLQAASNQTLSRAIQDAVRAERATDQELLEFVRASSIAALNSSERVEKARGDYRSPVNYPQTGLGRKLRNIAQLIDAGLGTRVYYVTLDGFDTHSNQLEAHASLLTELNDALTAFVRDLSEHGHLDRVMSLVFSEFGRRVKENASRGTDHGAAAPMFLAGGNVQGGLHGKYPSMTDLDDGDLKFNVDYRSVYAAILSQWLEISPASILGEGFKPMDGLLG